MTESTPPQTDHESGAYVQPSRWPLVVGTISILYSALGIIFLLIGLAGVFLGPWLQSAMMGIDPVAVPTALVIGQTAIILICLVLGVMLLVGGILTCKRRRRGPRLISIWAVGRLVMILLGIGFSFLTLDLNVQYQLHIGEGVKEFMEDRGMTTEQIQNAVPSEQVLRSRILVWPLVFFAMTAVCPIALGIVLSGRGIRADYQSWE